MFVPWTVSDVDPAEYGDSFMVRGTLGRAFSLLLTVTLGWPAYLFFNTAGRKYDRPASHFNPSSPIFTEKQYVVVLLFFFSFFFSFF
ncbi:MAG: hypothetical protein Q8P67_00015 [archaeon]|nr:hypothetical protein [archaeon]